MSTGEVACVLRKCRCCDGFAKTTTAAPIAHNVSAMYIVLPSIWCLYLTARLRTDPNATSNEQHAFSFRWIHDCKATGCLFNLSEDATVRNHYATNGHCSSSQFEISAKFFTHRVFAGTRTPYSLVPSCGNRWQLLTIAAPYYLRIRPGCIGQDALALTKTLSSRAAVYFRLTKPRLCPPLLKICLRRCRN